MILRIEDGIEAGGLTDNQGKFVDVTQLTSDLGGVKSRQTGVDEKSKLAAKWLYRLLGFVLVPALSLLVLGRAAVWVADGFGTGNQKYLK